MPKAAKCPAAVRRGQPIVRLTADLHRLIPTGRFHFMRQVNSAGDIHLLNDTWSVGKRRVGQYVRATLNTAEQRLTIWHKADEHADWRLLKTHAFRLKEPVHQRLPTFRRHCARCRDCWPD